MALYNPQQYCSHAFLYGGYDPGVGCRSYMAWNLWSLGYPDQALKSIQEALTLAQELSHPFSLAFALTFATLLHQLRREGHAVQDRAEAVIALCTEQGFPLFLAEGTIFRGWELVQQGQGAKGISQIREGLAAWRATGAEVYQSYFLAVLAEAHGQAAQVEEGLRTVVEALAFVERSEERFYEAELYRLQGELLLQQSPDNATETEACFQQAIDIARHQQAKSWELRAATSLARLWQQQGKTNEDRELLAPVYNWFTEGFDTPDLQDAKALFAELSEGV